MAIEQAIDEMQIAWAATARANRKIARQVRFRAGGEGSNFLVPDMDPLNPCLAANGIGEAVQAITDDAINAFDTGRGKGLGELICDCVCHGPSLVQASFYEGD